MADKLYFFSTEQGSLLIRLVIAHLLGDFLLQTGKMVENKKWFSREMLVHCVIIYGTTVLFTGWWLAALWIIVIHYLIDGLKIELQHRSSIEPWLLFTLDQFLHIITLVVVWACCLGIEAKVGSVIHYLFTDYNIGLLILGYLLVSAPVGYLIKFVLTSITSVSDNNTTEGEAETVSSQEQGGTFIGIFERVIILTFVLLNQYEAIGFLITGKSIIRFANKNEHIKSEYVLVGTMISYCIAILTGVLINYLMS